MAINVTDESFSQEVLKSELPVLVDFWAEWCGPCKMLEPIINEISNEVHGKIKIVKLNIDENPNTPSSLGVRSIPTMIIFNSGQVIDTKIGLQSKNSLLNWINSIIS